MKDQIELTNTNGAPVDTVGGLLKLLAPFRGEAEITPLHIYYIPIDGNASARIEIRIANSRLT